MKKVVHKVFFLLNIVWIVLMLLCMLSPHVPPSFTTLLALLALTYPVLVLLNIAWSLIWMLFKSWKFIYSLAAIGLCFMLSGSLIPFNSTDEKGELKVISFNCKLLGLYDEQVFQKELAAYLKKTNPDIICLQEFMNYKYEGSYFLERMKKDLGYPYVYFQAKVDDNNQNQLGLFLASKHKIVNKGRVPFKQVTSNLCAYADLEVDGKIIRVYNAHLQSIRFQESDYIAMDNEQEEVVKKGKSAVKRMQQAFKIREKQAKAIAKHRQSCEHPVLLCGDFNDVPLSYCVAKVSDGLEDAYKEAGNGAESTYIGKIPLLRIDYLFLSEEFKVCRYASNNKFPSDHKMILAEFKWED